MELGEAEPRPGWDPKPERLEAGAVRLWLQSHRFGVASADDEWWRVVDRQGRPLTEWSCLEGSQLRAEALEAEAQAEAADVTTPGAGPP